MKLDPERGAEDLKTFSRLCQFFGAIIYCIIGGAVYEYTPRGPQNFYWFSFIVGVAILGSAFFYPSSCETHGIIGHRDNKETEQK